MTVRKSIVDFYKNKNILITGATGFLGTSLVEKLLRSFPQVDKIYLLSREKKSVGYKERCRKYFNKKVFDEINMKDLNYLNKVVWLKGDLSAINDLGMSNRDLDMIKNEVNIVFHCAASTSFTQPLKEPLIKHLNATNDLLNIFNHKNVLDSFVYVSTVFSNVTRNRLDILDQLYPPHEDPHELLTLLNSLTTHELENKYKDLVSHCINTYFLSKNITENLVNEFGSAYPVGIFRPGILLASAYEPFPYWILGVNNGIEKVLQEISKGYHKRINPNSMSTAVPIDMAANATIATAWDIHNNSGRTGIYNYSALINPVTLQRCMDLYVDGLDQKELARKRLEYADSLESLLADITIERTGLGELMNMEFTFENKHIQNLWKKLTEDEQKLLFFDVSSISWRKYYGEMSAKRVQDKE